jgi:hypothetical protein
MTKINADRGWVCDVRIISADHQALLLAVFNVSRTYAVHMGQQWRMALLEKSHAPT